MGLVYETSTWLDRLWSEHLSISSGARELVQQGIRKQGPRFAGFPADVHARLYLPRDPNALESTADWAVRLHSLASELGEWALLRSMCSRNGFAAGIAAEAMLEQLLPHVPSRPEVPVQSQLPTVGDNSAESSTTREAPERRDDDVAANGPTDAELRATLRRASRAAKEAVENAEKGLEGLTTCLGFAGTSSVRQSGPADLKAIREAHARLGKSKRLRRIAELAGRLERLACTKARSRVRPGVGEIHGVGLGGDLSRVLPSELVTLRHSLLRRLTLAKIIERRALVYCMEGREPAARGPIVVLLDESSSMLDEGRDIWSKAVALALLATATRQRRSWTLVAFNGGIRREVTIMAGRATFQDLEAALDHDCRGGTDFEAPVMLAINKIEKSPVMRKADVIIITDGEDSLPAYAIKAATTLTKREGVSWFVVGVGPDSEQCVSSLGAIATSITRVHQTSQDEEIVEVINLVPKLEKEATCGFRSYYATSSSEL